jgi:hypothetical protein
MLSVISAWGTWDVRLTRGALWVALGCTGGEEGQGSTLHLSSHVWEGHSDSLALGHE